MTDDLAALVADIKERAEKATPGPWQSEWPMGDDGLDETGPRYIVAPAITVDPDTAVATLRPEQQEDAAFIAAADPATVLRLISALETAARERDHWHECFNTLAKATVGNTGLSAITEAGKLVSERDTLRADVKKLRAALKPYAKRADKYDGVPPSQMWRETDFEWHYPDSVDVLFTAGDCRRARATLKETDHG